MATHDDELRALRERAYRRHSDIDPESLRRLHHLEGLRIESESAPADEPEVRAAAAEPKPEVVELPPAPRPTPAPLLWLMGIRRSTIFILLAFALVAAGIVTALTLVQRVQTDPLQVGATQVARLGADAGYKIPDYFTSYSDDANPPQAFAKFNGLRIVTNSLPYINAQSPSLCMTLFSEATTTLTANSLSGLSFGGCAAGKFPATVLVPMETEQLPAELVAAFPDADALQFVYDDEHNEVVVFADAP